MMPRAFATFTGAQTPAGVWRRSVPVRAIPHPGSQDPPPPRDAGRSPLRAGGGRGRRDADAGRQAFLDLRCAACHQVAGETGFPDPISSNPGPDLGAVAAQPAGLIATSIIAPSHALSVNASGEVTARLEGILSPMGDYSRAMTVRQLLDLIAYLEAGDSRGR